MDMLDLRHEPSWAMWRKDLRRNDPPPFLGPLVTIKETAEALNRSITYVRARIDDGRLNTWKDPISKRVWILKDDLDILIGDNRALEEKAASRPKRPKNPIPQSEIHNPQSEDLDAIGGWEHPKPPPIIGGATIEESARESQARFDAKQRENEEWYAAEVAKLEDRDPEEAVRQLQLERGWLTPELPAEPATVTVQDSPIIGGRGAKPRKPVNRPISYSHPNPRPRTMPEPYVDPDDQPAVQGPQIEIPRRFPMGWINRFEAANVVQVVPSYFTTLARQHGLKRRKHRGSHGYLYDSVEVEQFAERRLDDSCKIQIPGKRLDWWGSRAKPMELQEFDYWITTAEAGEILGISRTRVGRLCDMGMLPCKQEKPGVRGSRIYVPHCAVYLLSQRPSYQRRRQIQADSSQSSSRWVKGKEEWDIKGFDPRMPSPATQINHGDHLTVRQTALALGVSVSAVKSLRARGRLTGVHLHPKHKGPGRNAYWFFLRTDVDNLLADPEYRRHAARGKKGQYRTG